MSIDKLKSLIPDYAKDIKLNLSSLVSDETLNEQQLWGTFLACALTTGNIKVIQAIEIRASLHLSDKEQGGAKAAAAIMAMNNIYYKFTGMMDDTYSTLPAKLRMNVLANSGADKVDFELWSLAVSAINGCQYCLKTHEKKLRDDGISALQIQTAVRIAAVIHAVAAVLDGEYALSADIEQEVAD